MYNLNMMKVIVCLYLIILCAFPVRAENSPVFVIGQDVQSIQDYMKITQSQTDGFMVYTAINDLRGLWEPVDQGAGMNYADQLIKEYPQMQVIQIGLYMRYMLKETTMGTFDNNIDQLGEWIKKTGKQVYLRIGYEFDNPENDYDPKQYILAYQHIVDRMKSDNISNVYFVWHTIAWRDKDWPAFEPLKWYPGDKYIDWVGISFFDSKQDEERNVIAQLALKLHKPLMIAESSPFSKYTDEEKLEWINKLFEYIKNNNIQFVSYINVNWDALSIFAKEKWGDARLQKRPVLIKEWVKQIEEYRQNKSKKSLK